MADIINRYKITLGLRLNDTGGSESYITPPGTDSVMTDLCRNLVNARLNMIHQNVKVSGVRVALIETGGAPVKRKSSFYRPGIQYPFVKPDANGAGGTQWDIPTQGANDGDLYLPDTERSSMTVEFSFGLTATRRYLFGMPDASMGGTPPTVNLDTPASLRPAWNVWRRLLLEKGWSIFGVKTTGDFIFRPIQKWVKLEGADGLVGVQVAAFTSSSLVVGKFCQIQGVTRRGTDKVSYNGRYIIAGIVQTTGDNPTTTVYLSATETGEAKSVKLPGVFRLYEKGYNIITDVRPVFAGSHKRGRPLGSLRGNRRKRISLDP